MNYLSTEQGERLLEMMESWDAGLLEQAREILITLLPSGAEIALHRWMRGESGGSWPQRCRSYLALRLLLLGVLDPEMVHLLTGCFGPKERTRLGQLSLMWARSSPPEVRALLPLVMAVIASDYRRPPHQMWPTLRTQGRDIVQRIVEPLAEQPLTQVDLFAGDAQ